MHISRSLILPAVAVTVLLSACGVSRTPKPSLQGPSELGLSLTLTANPDVLSMDGSSQSQVTINAFDSNGQPAPNIALRAEIVADGTLVDFGALSARTLVTANNGIARVTYTAPVAVQGTVPSLSIRITPSGTDAANATGRFVDIRLVPPGTINGGGPIPAFTWTPATPTASANVAFDATSTKASLGATITRYSWSFADGGTALGATPTHQFAASGTYHVFLTVTDSTGSSASVSHDVAIASGASPTADFAFSPSAPATNQTVNFNGGLSKAGAGHTLVRWDWDFGTGETASGVSVAKAYTTAGTYNVVLTVTDDGGQTALVTKGVSVTSAAGGGSGAPSALFTFSPASPGVGENVFFNASTSFAGTGHTIASYNWTFGDSATGTGINPTHAYTASGNYGVQLKVTDETGQSTTSSPTTVSVGSPPQAVANFTFSPNPPGRNDLVVFDASSSTTAQGQTIVDVAWNFGDGTAVIHCAAAGPVAPATAFDCPGPTNRISSHIFVTNQTFTVNLVVTDSAGRISNPSKALSVAVALASPNVVASASPGSPNPGTVVTFNSNATTYFPGSGPGSFSWTFGDGGTCSSASFPVGCGAGTAANPTHIYAAIGAYSVGLSVTDNKTCSPPGCNPAQPGRTGVSGTSVTVVAVPPPAPPVASFTVGPPSPKASVPGPGTQETFDGSGSTGSSLTYTWNTGDGTITSSGASPIFHYTYTTAGSYQATLRVTDGVTGLSNTSGAQTITVVP